MANSSPVAPAADDATARGLTTGEAAARLAADGPNVLPTARRRSHAAALAAQMVNFFAIMLWVAAALAWIAAMPHLAVAIAAVVVINGVFAFVQEYRADRAAAAVGDLLPARARALRDGRVVELDAEQLVVGDVVLLEAGDRVGADLRLDGVASLAIDASMLTGESAAVRPADGDPAFAGTFVVAGAARGDVVATGSGTRLASIAGMTLAAKRPRSPLSQQLHRVVRTVSWIAIATGGVAFAASVLLGTPPAQGFLFAIGVTVALVPEGLLPTVTLSLARSAQVMAKRRALVRRLEAVETLGTTTFICTDKTGTITRNEMNVVRVWSPAGIVDVRGEGYAPTATVDGDVDALGAARIAVASAARCVEGHAERVDGAWVARGDPMDVALHVAAWRLEGGVDAGGEVAADEKRWSGTADVARVPFDPAARCSGAVDDEWVHVLGAAESVLPRCRDSGVDGRGSGDGDAWRHLADEAVAQASTAGLRVVAVARARRDASGVDDGRAPWDADGLAFLGIVCLEDPPRDGIAEALARCRGAGISVAMLTGDHPRTAAAIARSVGLLRDEGRVLEGDQLPSGDDELGALLDADGVVIARITPEGKLRVARALQRRGHIVAMTGDGVNDGPALRQADIGVAMGRGGTDVAREAADVVLMDDHFATIVAAVELGRATWSNVRRFLTYHLTDNVAELAPFVVWSLTAGHVPLALGVLQVLALDIGTDLLPALALGAEPASTRIMSGRLKTDSLIDGRLLRRVFLVLGPIEATVSMLAFIAVLTSAGWTWGDDPDPVTLAAASGAAFIAVVLGQLANAFACRAEHRPFWRVPFASNPLLLWAVASELVVLGVFMFVPFVARLLGGSPPPMIGWGIAAAAVPALLLGDTLHKQLRARRTRRSASVVDARGATVQA